MKITIDGKPYEVEVKPGEVLVEGKSYPVRSARTGNQVDVEVGGTAHQVELKGDSVVVDGKAYAVAMEAVKPAAVAQPATRSTRGASSGSRRPAPGALWRRPGPRR